MCSTVWGVKQLDADSNILHVEPVKSRDFAPPEPFQLIGRPYIDECGDFRMHKRPSECGALMDEQQPERDKGGAPAQAREARAANVALMRAWLAENPRQTSEELARRFAKEGITVATSTVRKYKMELEK